jgi:hypothetical protein
MNSTKGTTLVKELLSLVGYRVAIVLKRKKLIRAV